MIDVFTCRGLFLHHRCGQIWSGLTYTSMKRPCWTAQDFWIRMSPKPCFWNILPLLSLSRGWAVPFDPVYMRRKGGREWGKYRWRGAGVEGGVGCARGCRVGGPLRPRSCLASCQPPHIVRPPLKNRLRQLMLLQLMLGCLNFEAEEDTRCRGISLNCIALHCQQKHCKSSCWRIVTRWEE